MTSLWILSAALASLNAGLLVSGGSDGAYLHQVKLSAFLQMHQPRDLLFRKMPPLLLLLMVCCLALFLLSLTWRADLAGPQVRLRWCWPIPWLLCG